MLKLSSIRGILQTSSASELIISLCMPAPLWMPTATSNYSHDIEQESRRSHHNSEKWRLSL
uniref:Uncharacterized protein n=1 Tax=Anguilla anguilla TaxID=7936 RepID=A0A0E9TFR8_ANGAN